MDAEQLLEHFDRVAEAPGSIAALRRFILDLAVRGKLVDQDPNDEPASELLKRIQAEEKKLVKEGKIKKQKLLPTFEDTEIPFNTPANWLWLRLGNIGDWGSGSTPPRGNSEYYDGDITWLKSGELGDSISLKGSQEKISTLALEKCSFRLNQPGDVLIAMYGATIGKLAILSEVAVTNQAVCGCTPFDGVFNKYLFLFLASRREDFHNQSEGGAQPNISKIKIVLSPIPLPPIREQHQIVAKVDELMDLCDRLEAAQKNRENLRDRLVAASLHQLNQAADSNEKFFDRARFYFDNLAKLSVRSEHINQLRQTILELAVRGKLIPQNPNDEPASKLLHQIQIKKKQLVDNREVKSDIVLPPVNDADAPFQLPLGWTWARFPEIGIFGRGKSKHRPRNDSSLFRDGTHFFVQTGDVARSHGNITSYSNKYNEMGLAQSKKWPKGTLCITIAANIADSGILSFDACFPDSIVGFIPEPMFLGARYFEYFIRTAKANLLEYAPATAQKNINLGILNAVLIPLPPLTEQHRIVTRIDELMVLCDRLEIQISNTQIDSHQLLESLIQKTLSESA
jgi:type I restriction enzyme, S subunit